ncbi:phosphodiester glycosidase family protein [Streptomyces sp. NBC_01717]|uniref:phosphodiester glycosidase family protein n=1 Tax=Streptomyces sp. NBC_01717 TaxID=2975918 RepID=UPI002E3324DA|nr:phosphodiester glycosidase family protein [Streptomyces sp. NBC_01717]
MSDIADKPRRSASRVKRATWRGAAFGAALTLAALVPPAVANAGAADSGRPVASGSGGIAWTTAGVAPGVQVRTGVLRNSGAAAVWTVTVQAPAVNRLTGAATWAPLGDRAWADSTAGRLREAGFEPRLEQVLWDEYADAPRGTMGWQVRVGRYATQDQAGTMNSAVSAAGFRTSVEWTGYDGRQAADAENIHVAVLDPARLHGTIAVSDGGNVADREKTSAVAARLGSLIGVNGGFFITSDSDGVQGTVAGLSAVHGRLESMAVGSRAALILGDGGRRPRIADLSTTVTVRAGAATYGVQGINRVPGKVRNCGRPGAAPTDQPRHDTTCTLADDLVKFTPAFRAPLPTGPGVQTVLDKHGIVVSTGGRGGVAPEHGSVLQGTGAAGNWLTDHARVGKRLSLREVVRDSSGRQVRLGPDDSIVSAAPTLVEDGRVHIDAATEGTLDPQDLSFGFAWSNVRQPRTLAGIDGRGRLLLVTVDGRQPGVSEGFTLGEAARFMRSLGAVQALNLDGGGSSAMAVKGSLVNVTSDVTGERAVGDTIQVLPGRRTS